jgi:toxin CcdB
MSQFSVCRNKNAATKSIFPLLLDVQSDLLGDLHSRIVIPLTKSPIALRKPLSRLTPIIKVDGVEHLLVTHQLASIPTSVLGPIVAEAAEHRDAIISALDMLVTGI